jgi:hypothetical protein
MYVNLLRLLLEVSGQSPMLYIGLLVLLMTSWGLVMGAILDIAVRLFDVKDR